MVYVLDVDGKRLMSTERHGKVRHLLNDKKSQGGKEKPFYHPAFI